jgi:hypothetical protein
MRWMYWTALVMFAATRGAGAQGLDDGRAGVAPSAHADATPGVRASASAADTLGDWTPRPHIGSLSLQQRRTIAPLVSAALPGSGQWLLGQNRSLAYLAVEAVAWWRYTTDIRERSLQVERFKDIARRVARAQFSPAPPDSDWQFYEMMRDYDESGQYSMSATGPIVPETDAKTFNGSRWALAQATNSTYADALAEYERTAVKPDFRWSWKNARLQQDIFKRTTEKRNDADRAATRDLIVIGVNHIISMVDAFTTMRLQVRAEADGRTSISGSLRW